MPVLDEQDLVLVKRPDQDLKMDDTTRYFVLKFSDIAKRKCFAKEHNWFASASDGSFKDVYFLIIFSQSKKSREENPQKLTQLSSRSHPRHLVGKRTAQKDTSIDITSDSQVNSNFHTGGHRLV